VLDATIRQVWSKGTVMGMTAHGNDACRMGLDGGAKDRLGLHPDGASLAPRKDRGHDKALLVI
jgi:hypothetical protein